jgi:nitric oxide reductase
LTTSVVAFQAEPARDAAQAAPHFPFRRPKEAVPPKEYGELLRKCPISKGKLFDNKDIWLVTKLKDVQTVLKHDGLSKVRTNPNFPELSEGAKAAIEGREATYVDMDPPQHTKFRSMFDPGFSRQRVDAMVPSIRSKVEELINDMKLKRWKGGEESIDLQENFSLPLAFKVIYELLGIPFSDYKFLSNNVAVRASASGTAREAAAAQQQLTEYMENLVAQKEKNPSNDLISEVIQKHMKKGEITRDQLVAHAFLLLVAGNATVASMINFGVLTLLQHPDQLEAVKMDPSLWPSAVSEICRYHTASSYALRRVALRDVEIGGVKIKKDEGVIALNMAANRDPEVFNDPDRFDIRRSPNPHVAFGYGTHECPGEYLSYKELEAALEGLFTHLPGLKVAVPMDKLQYTPPDRDIGLLALPVTWKSGKDEGKGVNDKQYHGMK